MGQARSAGTPGAEGSGVSAIGNRGQNSGHRRRCCTSTHVRESPGASCVLLSQSVGRLSLWGGLSVCPPATPVRLGGLPG